MNPDGQFGINRTALAAVPVGRLFFGDTINSVTGIPLPRILVPGTGSMFYYSVDDWRTVEQFNLTKHPIGVPICQISDQTISWLIQHAVLHDRLLVATNFGLLQLLSTRGKKKYPQMPTETVILAKCVNKIIFPPLDTQDTPYLTAITVDYEIFTAPYFSPNGSLIFTAVLSKENFYTGIQKLLPNYGRHGVIDVVEGTSRGVLALMSGDSMSMDVTDPGKTCLIFVDAATSAMTIRSCLPSFIPEADGRLPFIAIDNSTSYSTRVVSINRVLRSEVIAKEIYAVGNVAFFSSDGGITWKFFSSFAPRGSLFRGQVSKAGRRMLVLTVLTPRREDEIWISNWGQPSFYRIYPSSAWDTALMLSGDTALWQTWQAAEYRKLLSVYFDWFGNPFQLFSVYIMDGWKTLRIPLRAEEIIASLSSSALNVLADAPALQSFTTKNCPQVQVKVNRRHYLERLEYYRFLKPRTGMSAPFPNLTIPTVYSATIQTLLNYSIKSMDNNYTTSEAGSMEHVSGYFADSPFPTKWEFEKMVARSDPDRIVVLEEDNKNMQLADDDPVFTEFPQKLFVDRGDTVVITATVYDFIPTGSFGVQDDSEFPQISFRMENGSLINGSTEAAYDPEKHILTYKIVLQETGSLQPAPPGGNLVKEAFSLIIPQPAECYPNQAVYETTVHIGCLPATELQYNWQLVLASSTTNRTFFDCTDPEPNMPCIDHSASMSLFLELVDHAGNQGYNFTGAYRMFVIGFGMGNPRNIQRFNESEVALYNTDFPDGSNSKKLIWVPLNDNPLYANDPRVLDHFHNKIQFVCSSGSPCGDPKISIAEEPHLNFLVRITNGGLPDVTTYCLFDLEFVVRIRGADPNPYTVSIPVLVTTLIVLCVLCLLYVGLYFWRLKIAAAYAAYLHQTRTVSHSGGSGDSVHYQLSHKSVAYAKQ